MIPLGIGIVALGLLTFWLPLPIGLPLMLVGLVILLQHSSVIRRAAAAAYRRHPAFRSVFRQLRGLQRRLGRRLSGRGRANESVRRDPG